MLDGDARRGATTVRVTVTVDGRPVRVPASIGVGPGFHSPIRTLDATGTVHVDGRGRTLGQLLTQWGVRATADCLGAYCRPRATIAPAGDVRRVPLVAGRTISIVITTR